MMETEEEINSSKIQDTKVEVTEKEPNQFTNEKTVEESTDSEKPDDELTETATEDSTTSDVLPVHVANITSSDNTDDEPQLRCFECGVTNCVMWRRHSSSKLMCNICHLKYIKSTIQPSGNTLNSKLINSLVIQNNKTKEQQFPRISKRKSKTNKKFANGAYDRIIKNTNLKNRRNLFKRKPSKAAEGISSILQTNAIYHNGLMYEVGDIVCTNDIDGSLYFAQVRGFFQNEYCDKSVVITWLIPTQANPTQFDPMKFLPGLDEDSPRPMDCFDFVCRAPSDLYKSRLSHSPYQRSQVTLENLIHAANALDEDNNTEIKTKHTMK